MTEPALTPSEWRLLRLWNAGKMPGGRVRGMVVLGLPESHKHGAAACALYGQPFGFTHEDIEILRTMSTTADASDYAGWLAEPLTSIADRLEALLPPKTP